jgi:hypothetical protein
MIVALLLVGVCCHVVHGSAAPDARSSYAMPCELDQGVEEAVLPQLAGVVALAVNVRATGPELALVTSPPVRGRVVMLAPKTSPPRWI